MGRNYRLRVAIEKQLKDRITTMNDKELSGLYSYMIPCSCCLISNKCTKLKNLTCEQKIELALKEV